MRAGPRYDCARCGLEDAVREEVCRARCPDARDEHGNAPPPPSSVTLTMSRARGRTFLDLVVHVNGMRGRRALRQLVDDAGPEVPIGEASDGIVAIAGAVDVLSPPPDLAEDVAAYVTATRYRSYGELDRNGKPKKGHVERVQVRRGAGRFLVRDETGVALVDDDWLELFDPRWRRPSPASPGELAVFAGDHVHVLGYARRVPLPSLGLTGAAGYRGSPTGLRFDGGSDRSVVMFSADPMVSG